ncbi:MAG: putative rane transporter protein YjnA [Pseudomonadota bacterium]
MNPEFPLAGLLVGIMVGATGVGGGAVMTPLLVLVLGVAPTTAVGTDLLYASITKLFGAGTHSLQGRVDWQVVRWLALGSLPTAAATLAWLHQAGTGGPSPGLLITMLGVVLMLTAVAIVALRWLSGPRARWRYVGLPGDSPWLPSLAILGGSVLGFLVTFTSIGAGSLGVVMMLLLFPIRLPAARLVGTDLAHAIPLALVAGAGHIFLGNVDFALLGQLLVGSIPGVWIGAHFGGKLPETALRIAIATVLGIVGFKLVF